MTFTVNTLMPDKIHTFQVSNHSLEKQHGLTLVFRAIKICSIPELPLIIIPELIRSETSFLNSVRIMLP